MNTSMLHKPTPLQAKQLEDDAQRVNWLINSIDELMGDISGRYKKIKRELPRAELLTGRDRTRIYRHTLQLRLDNYDLIKVLLNTHESLCRTLGIEPQNDHARNLERIRYVLGDITIQHELDKIGKLLNELEAIHDMLNKEERLWEHSQELLHQLAHNIPNRPKATFSRTFKEAHQEATPNPSIAHKPPLRTHSLMLLEEIEHEMKGVIELQAKFKDSLMQLTEVFQRYEGLPQLFSLLYNHIEEVSKLNKEWLIQAEHWLQLLDAMTAHIEPTLKPQPTLAPEPNLNESYFQHSLQEMNDLAFKIQEQKSHLETHFKKNQHHLKHLERLNRQFTKPPVLTPPRKKPDFTEIPSFAPWRRSLTLYPKG